MVKNLPSNAGDVSSIPGPGTKIPYAGGQLSLCTATTKPIRSRASLRNKRSLQAAMKTQHSQIVK